MCFSFCPNDCLLLFKFLSLAVLIVDDLVGRQASRDRWTGKHRIRKLQVAKRLAAFGCSILIQLKEGKTMCFLRLLFGRC